jgi:cation:H+ antiporter
MSTFAIVLPYACLLSGFVVLYFGAEWLVGASARLAVRFGVKPLLVGVTVVALGTSAPEFVVSVKSALDGVGGIAVGNVIGSNICNTALVLGLSALICPILVTRQFFKFDIPVLIGASFLTWYFLSDDTVRVWEGIVLLALFAGYMAFNIAHAKAERGAAEDIGVAGIDSGGGSGVKRISVAKNTLLVLLGLAMLIGGAELLVKGAVKIAESFHVSDAVIGLTVVAFGTSLPELATSVVAAVRKHNDIAVGNVVGSNLFNILCILGVVGAMGPIKTVSADGGRGVVFMDLLFMSVINVVLLAPLITKSVINRWIGGLLTATYVAYMLILAFY